MKKPIKVLSMLYFLFFGMLLSMRSAHAYIDPATTSYLLQIVAGVFIAAGATIALFWRKITFYFKKKKALRARKKKEQSR